MHNTSCQKICRNRLENVTIDVLITFSMSGLHGVFTSMISKNMQGPGVLFLYNGSAYFEKFPVNITVGFIVVVVVV